MDGPRPARPTSGPRGGGNVCRPGPRRRPARAPRGARPRSPGFPCRSVTRGRRARPASVDEDLGDLDRVGGGALAQVVADDPEGEAATVGYRRVRPDPADEDLVAPGSLRGKRIQVGSRVVTDDHARHRPEELAGAL